MDIIGFQEGLDIDGQGLQHVALKIALHPTKRLKTKIDLNVFAFPNPVFDNFIGNELDFSWAYAMGKGLHLKGGASYFIWEDRDANDTWGWMQLTGKM